MKSAKQGQWGVTFLLGLVLLAAPAAAQPIGKIGGLVAGGNAASGLAGLEGWAVDLIGVRYVDIYVDGQLVGRADYGAASPGVAAAFPNYPNSDKARWGFMLDTTRFLNGNHTVQARMVSITGLTRFSNSMRFEFFNTTANLKPFGAIERPQANDELYGVCDIFDPDRRYEVVTGWAVDAGLTPSDTGVKWVQLMINGTIVYDSKTSCDYIAELGGLSNCYGLVHQGSESRFPHLIDPPHAGFRFVLDIGWLVSQGYLQGHHTLSIRAGDIGNQVAEIDRRVVSFLCDDAIGNEGAFGFIARPTMSTLQAHTMVLPGWSLDWDGIDEVRLFIDGELYDAKAPSEGRPLVTSLYPGYPDSLAPGWRFSVDTNQFENGEHVAWVVIRDVTGAETTIGERRFTIYNP